MTQACVRLHDYVDGELEADELTAFEAHLADCDACGAELPRLLAVMAALDAAVPALGGAAKAPPPLTVVHGGAAAVGASIPAGPRHHRGRWIATSALGAAAAAAIALFVIRPPAAPVVAALQDQLGPSRHIEPRLSYAGAERYRPLDVARGGTSNEAISIDRMGQLEHAKDWHGVAVAALLAGERERAQRFFAQAAATPAVETDRAALELLDGRPDALERALDDVDRALAQAPNDPSALWNRALVLAALDAPLAAAREFDRVTALGEPGWAAEAQTRAASLRDAVQQRRTRWKRANDAGSRLLADGTPVPLELTSVTGYMTIMLYDAVRAAPSRERIEALLPMAQALDAAYRSDRLTRYVRRIAASDFRIRKPLAETYRALIVQGALPDAEVDRFLKRLEDTATDDIWMGAIVRTARVAGHLDDYRRRAAASGDPWFAAIAEHELAKAEIARGELPAAERRLRAAIGVARREHLAYRAILLEDQLVGLLRTTRRLSHAATEARIEYRDAIVNGDCLRELNALSELAAVNALRYSNGLARVYLTEQIERSSSSAEPGASRVDQQYDCARRQYAYQTLADISLLLLEPGRARAELASGAPCKGALALAQEPVLQRSLTLTNAFSWADLYRSSHDDQDAQLARAALASLQDGSELTEGDRALSAYIEGSLLIERDPAAGRRALRDAVTRADHRTDEHSLKAQIYGLSLLALDAGRAAEFSDVVRDLAETLEVPVPTRCAIAIAAQGDRSVVAFVDAGGAAGGTYVANRKQPELDIPTLIPTATLDRLRACEQVSVLSRPPVLGAARLLPAEFAWSYAVMASTPAAGALISAAAPRLVVANPEPPADLDLPTLGPYPAEPTDATVVLRGRDATPTRVLQAMRDAAVIEFHTHGFIANDVSEASYLVLSTDLDQQYAMTAGDIARVKLAAEPLVILGACHAGASSHSFEGRMGLADSFLRSGARAVIASPDTVQDLGAPALFAAIRERVVHGAAPATAVRDERLRRIATAHGDTWASDIVVFQ